MRRNRKITRHYSSLSGITALVAGLLMMLLVATMVYYFVDSKCNQLSQSIGREKNRLAQLEKERKRESARWEQMKTRTGLDEALRQDRRQRQGRPRADLSGKDKAEPGCG